MAAGRFETSFLANALSASSGTRTSAKNSVRSYRPSVMPQESGPYSPARSVAPGRKWYSSSRHSTPTATPTGPAGNSNVSPASEAPATWRSNSSFEVCSVATNARFRRDRSRCRGIHGHAAECDTDATCGITLRIDHDVGAEPDAFVNRRPRSTDPCASAGTGKSVPMPRTF